MVQNLWWATGYNVLAIPVATGALYSAGIPLTPAVGAVLMSVSTRSWRSMRVYSGSAGDDDLAHGSFLVTRRPRSRPRGQRTSSTGRVVSLAGVHRWFTGQSA